MNNQERLRRIESEIAVVERGDLGEAPLWLYLLGWADWQTERCMLLEKMAANAGKSETKDGRTGADPSHLH